MCHSVKVTHPTNLVAIGRNGQISQIQQLFNRYILIACDGFTVSLCMVCHLLHCHVQSLAKAVHKFKVTEIAYHLIAFPFTVKGYFPGQFVYLAQLTIIHHIRIDGTVLSRAHGKLNITLIAHLKSRLIHFNPVALFILFGVFERDNESIAQSLVYWQM